MSTKSTKLSTREIAASAMLMTAISSATADRKDLLGEVMRRAQAQYGEPTTPNDKRFEVQLFVNGVELDWPAFEAHASEQMEAMVREAAAGLVRHILHTDVQAALDRLTNAADMLATGIEAEAQRLLERP
jgi:hypothetical protein